MTQIPTDEEQMEWLPERPPFQRFMKRLIDITVATLAIIIALLVWIIIALAIKLTSRGPIFLRQRCIGYQCREFRLMKFRAMNVNRQLGQETP
jgi:lipopolysaccharide/colanic/teichoic acid biosynthesis glycosyltransferase